MRQHDVGGDQRDDPAASSRAACPRSSAAPAGYEEPRRRSSSPPSPRAHRTCRMPDLCARSTRNASEKRASVSTAASGDDDRSGGRAGSRRPAQLRPAPVRGRAVRFAHADDDQQHAQRGGNDRKPERGAEVAGEPRHRATASSGPPIAPTVSSAWRSPKLAPRAPAAPDRRSARRAVRRGCPCRRDRRSARPPPSRASAPAERRAWSARRARSPAAPAACARVRSDR